MSDGDDTTATDPHRDHPVLVAVRNLKTYFPLRKGVFSGITGQVKAVDGISLDVHRSRTLGLVGESGCGKTTFGRTILRLIRASAGSVRFDDVDLFQLDERSLRAMRRHMQIIFQDSASSLNPRMAVQAIIGEPLSVHRLARGKALRDRVAALLERVGLTAADMMRYPHEFSGGQRQRIAIARAIAVNPKFIVCDEPVSSLDVSVRSQILNLLADLQNEYPLSYLFMAHDLAVVRHFCDTVAVMYLGKIVESASSAEIFAHPRHPYTQALLAAAPQPDPSQRHRKVTLQGEVPSPMDPPSGCMFHPRCPFAIEECRRVKPALEHKAGTTVNHLVACHLADEGLSSHSAVDAHTFL